MAGGRQVTGVMTQGRSDGQQWVTSFVVSYSLDAYTWKYAADFNGNRKVGSILATFLQLYGGVTREKGRGGSQSPPRAQQVRGMAQSNLTEIIGPILWV